MYNIYWLMSTTEDCLAKFSLHIAMYEVCVIYFKYVEAFIFYLFIYNIQFLKIVTLNTYYI